MFVVWYGKIWKNFMRSLSLFCVSINTLDWSSQNTVWLCHEFKYLIFCIMYRVYTYSKLFIWNIYVMPLITTTAKNWMIWRFEGATREWCGTWFSWISNFTWKMLSLYYIFKRKVTYWKIFSQRKEEQKKQTCIGFVLMWPFTSMKHLW